AAKQGDTMETIGKRYGVQTTSMERINRRPKSDVLNEGDPVVVYLPANSPMAANAINAPDTTPVSAPDPLGPLPTAPAPSALPR
ncbi:MAG TPA: LysM domain-containing protein, partial [Polyangiaceae bacterium]